MFWGEQVQLWAGWCKGLCRGVAPAASMWLTPLACAGVRRFRNSTPSNPEGPQVSEDAKEAFRATIPAYRCAGQLLVLVTGSGLIGTWARDGADAGSLWDLSARSHLTCSLLSACRE